jgi:uncharacterized protein
VILEGLVTTLDEYGEPNIAPMGALVDETMTELVLRPYRTSKTFANLKRTRQGVLHVTDDVEMLAHAAIDRLTPMPKVVMAKEVDGVIIAHACRWYEFRVTKLDERAERTTIACRQVSQGRIRDFFGFNRAKHAVLEAAILATRIHLTPPQEIAQEFKRLAVLVEKTGGAAERRAFLLLEAYVAERSKEFGAAEG